MKQMNFAGFAFESGSRLVSAPGIQNVSIAARHAALLPFGYRMDSGSLAIDESMPSDPEKPCKYVSIPDFHDFLAERWRQTFAGVKSAKELHIVSGDIGTVEVDASGLVYGTRSSTESDDLITYKKSELHKSQRLGVITAFYRIESTGSLTSVEWDIRWEPPVTEHVTAVSSLRDPFMVLKPCAEVISALLCIRIPAATLLIILAVICLIGIGTPAILMAFSATWRRFRIHQLFPLGARYQVGFRRPIGTAWWSNVDRLSDEVLSSVSVSIIGAARIFTNSLILFLGKRNIRCTELDGLTVSNVTYDFRHNKGAIVGKIRKMRGRIVGRGNERVDVKQSNVSSVAE